MTNGTTSSGPTPEGSGQTPKPTAQMTNKALRRSKLTLLRAKIEIDNDDYFNSLTPDEQQQAVTLSLKISTMVLLIENAQIQLIDARAEENIAGLDQATRDLETAMTNIRDVVRFLGAVAKVLALVARVVAL